MDNPVSIKNDLGSFINPSPFCSLFLWDCQNNETQFLGRNDMFPADTKNPFDYFSVHDVIGPEYRSVYDVFYSQILSGMLCGTENEDLVTDISLRLSETDSEYRLCHIITNFKKDETGKITAVFCRIRPFTSAKLEQEKAALAKLRREVGAFRNNLLNMYREHLGLINNIPGLDDEEEDETAAAAGNEEKAAASAEA